MSIAVQKRKRNRTARERALLLAASKLFASRGYEATTTREIAARAGCAEGLIHRYFANKAGLLLAIIKCQVSQEVLDLNARLPLAPSVGAEIIQLVDWEVERMWRDREFLRVVIPRALLDPGLGQLFTRIGPLERTKAFDERLRKFKECRALPDQEIDASGAFCLRAWVHVRICPARWCCGRTAIGPGKWQRPSPELSLVTSSRRNLLITTKATA